MIWRSSLTHQDYMKYDVQPMTTKFSIRTNKGKPTTKTTTKPTSVTPPPVNAPQPEYHSDQDSMDDDDEDDETNEETPSNQVLFLNFTSDLSPQTSSPRKKSSTQTKKAAYRVNGVNILNRKNLDSKTAIERMQRRRENHNHVERRRRDTINNTIYELSQVVPNALHTGQKPHKGNILKATLDYILVLQAENQMYRSQLATTNSVPGLATPLPAVSPSSSSSTASSMTTLPHSTFTLPTLAPALSSIPPVLPSLSPVSPDTDFS